MNQILRGIIKFRKTILIGFSIIAVLCILMIPGTSVNYKMVDYLPEEANSTKAISVLEEEFGNGLPNLSIMMEVSSIQEALAYKTDIEALEGITSVMWLDDMVGLETITSTPIKYLDQSLTESYYKDGTALYMAVVANGMESETVALVYDLIGENNAITGEALTNASAQNSSSREVIGALFILLPIIIIMLIIATDSWIEPIMFLTTIGIAIFINMGTNIILGEVSFVTFTVSPILQLAVSMDYAIFLLHSFSEKRKKYEPEEAMFHAMKASLPTVAASALTTMIGFSALMFMRFGIGGDLGLNLLKGIILSFLSVMIFLPVLTLVFYKWIDKTTHKEFMPHPGKISRVLLKIRIPMLVIALILAIPAFLGQSEVDFLYGMKVDEDGARSYIDQEAIEAVYGDDQAILLMVPREEITKEAEMVSVLETIPGVTQVMAYTSEVGTKIPDAYIPEEAISQFYSDNYARVIIYTDMAVEGDETFDFVDQILLAAETYYDEYYLTGQSPTLNDMKKVVTEDVGRINLIAVIGIFIVLLLTFKSISIPLVLVFVIETAIWMNLSVPYFRGTPISFIGYLILTTVQLGATVDYAILMTHKYLDERKQAPKGQAMWNTIKNNVAAILISATILSMAGFALAGTTQIGIIKELGILLGRGTILSFVMVVAVMPALLLLLDKVIKKTTLSHGFYDKKED